MNTEFLENRDKYNLVTIEAEKVMIIDGNIFLINDMILQMISINIYINIWSNN